MKSRMLWKGVTKAGSRWLRKMKRVTRIVSIKMLAQL
jgi:hypothetical protein